MNGRITASLSSSLLLMGAFSIGWMLHQTLIRGTLSLTSPIAVAALLGGGILVCLGYRLKDRLAPGEFISGGTTRDDEEYVEEVSPLNEEWLDGLDQDDSYDR